MLFTNYIPECPEGVTLTYLLRRARAKFSGDRLRKALLPSAVPPLKDAAYAVVVGTKRHGLNSGDIDDMSHMIDHI